MVALAVGGDAVVVIVVEDLAVVGHGVAVLVGRHVEVVGRFVRGGRRFGRLGVDEVVVSVVAEGDLGADLVGRAGRWFDSLGVAVGYRCLGFGLGGERIGVRRSGEARDLRVLAEDVSVATAGTLFELLDGYDDLAAPFFALAFDFGVSVVVSEQRTSKGHCLTVPSHHIKNVLPLGTRS